ncbi:hypothetical protein L596_003051 [Steinernema carpocapsae]|uniref:Uncharacterized protein n=1 Tax=Steinernema carpocapsae TaxID=34508 RepID=A0A4U8URH5_STECR|nr:hypothetical protein L596_003051 [Steinernema carpocapsae]
MEPPPNSDQFAFVSVIVAAILFTISPLVFFRHVVHQGSLFSSSLKSSILGRHPMALEENNHDSDFRRNGADPYSMKKISSFSSIGSLDEEIASSDYYSDDLDKLSMCLSEAESSESGNEAKQNALIYDIFQANLALWTLVFSLTYSYAWQQHRKKFLFSMVFVIPSVFLFACGLSVLMSFIVVCGRFLSTPFGIDHIIGGCTSEEETFGGRRRTASGNSVRSSLSLRSPSLEELPKPLCRRHSSSGSLAGSVNGSRPPSRLRKFSYSHCSGGGDEFASAEGSNGN